MRDRRAFLRTTATASAATSLVASRGWATRVPSDLRSIQYGETRSGAIDEEDPTDDYYSDVGTFYAEPVTFEASEGDRVEITMESSEVDAWLRLEAPDESSVADDDDGGEGTNAQLTVTLEQDGQYTIWASTYNDEATGTYTLSLARVEQTATPTPTPTPTEDTADLRSIQYGETKSGMITAEDPTDEYYSDDGTFYAEPVTFEANEGDRVEITMQSSEINTWLRLEGPDGGFVADDDDGGEGTNSQLTVTLGQDGEYTIWASTYNDEATGPYTLSLEQAPQETATGESSDLRSIQYGETRDGSIDGDDPPDDYYEGVYYAEPVTFEGSEGERVEITMESSEVNAWLRLEAPDESSVADDDDGGEGTNAQLTVTLEQDGQYTIWASTNSAESTGSYTLSLELISETTMSDNETVSGTVRDINDDRVPNGRVEAYHVPQPRTETIQQIGMATVDDGEFEFEFDTNPEQLVSQYSESVVIVARQVFGTGMVPSDFWFTAQEFDSDVFFDTERDHTLYLTEERLLTSVSSSTDSSTNPNGGIVSIWRSVDQSDSSQQTLHVEITAPFPYLLEASLGVEVPENGVTVDYSDDGGTRVEWAGDSETALNDGYTGPPERVFEEWVPTESTVPTYVPMEAAGLESPFTDGELYIERGDEELSEKKKNLISGVLGFVPVVGDAVGAAGLIKNAIESDFGNSRVSLGVGAGEVDPNTTDVIEAQFEGTTTSLVLVVPLTVEMDSFDVAVRGLWKTTSVTTELSQPFPNLSGNPSGPG